MTWIYALVAIAYLVGGFLFVKYKVWRRPYWLCRMKFSYHPITNPRGGTFRNYQEFLKSPVNDDMATFWFFLWPIAAIVHVLAILIFGTGSLLLKPSELAFSLLLSLVRFPIFRAGKMIKSLAHVNGNH